MSHGRDVIAKQINYQVHKEYAPSYKYMRIQLHNFPSSSLDIDNTQQLLQWQLPSNYGYNLSKSYIAYNLSIPAQGAGNYIWTHEDVFTLGTEISFGTSGGMNLVDLKFCNNYSKICRKLDTKLETLLSNDETSQLYKCNTITSENKVAAVNPTATGSVNYMESRYTKSYAANTAISKNVNYPLSAFTNTLFAVDKDLLCGNSEMFLRIQSAPLNRMAWVSTSATNPNAGSAGPPIVPGAVDVVGSGRLNQVFLYLAVEQNEEINKSLRIIYNEGKFKLNIPYTVGFTQGTTVAGPSNINVQITKQYGKRLTQVLYSVFNQNNSRHLAFDCDNYNASKLINYRTAIDSKYLQDYQLSCLNPIGVNMNSDDWYIANRKFCHGTCVMDRETYKINWFHLDRFYEKNDQENEDNLDVGIPLPVQTLNYIVEGTTFTGSLVHHAYCTFRRTYLINPMGISMEVDNLGITPL